MFEVLPRNILCVCQGNTCRSPAMEYALLFHPLRELGYVSYTVESAGLLHSAAEGKPASEGSLLALKRRGINIDRHRSRFLADLHHEDFDLFITVGENEKDQLIQNYDIEADKIIILNAEDGGIPNPWNKSQQDYNECIKLIFGKVDELVRKLWNWE